jgi:hypothetical protein
MNIVHDMHADNSLDCLIAGAYIINQAVGRSDRTLQKIAAPTYHKKEVIMRSHAHTATWGTHIGVGHGHDAKRWYEHLKAWWTAHKAIRREARLAAIAARWDATREALTPLRADAAVDMVAAEHAFTAATTLYGLAQ